MEKGLGVLIGLILGMALLSYPFYVYQTQEKMICTVENKERINTKESSKYVIFCEEEVIQNTDELLVFKFNSSDFYKNLKIGNKYNLLVYGWRIPFLSTYRNVIKIF